MKKSLAVAFVLLPLLGLTALAQVRELQSPATEGSAQPNLAVSSDGRVYLSWIDRLGEGRFALRFSTLERGAWSSPKVIAEGGNWFVNWADFPSMTVLADGSLAAHWLVKSGPDSYAYDVTISRSFDGGRTWEKPFVPHRDGVRSEHGFVSLFPSKNGNLAAVWLDGREMKGGEGSHDHDKGNMTLRYVEVRRDGTLMNEAVLDTRVCECCQTSAAMTSDGPVVVYRDRSDAAKEIRDISIVKLKNNQWSSPRTVFADNWELSGCPVNGPAVAASGKRVAVAWYSAANNTPRVRLAFSDDAGGSFGQPVVVDDGNPIGRVDVFLLEDGGALVCWLEKLTGGGAVRVRRITRDGKVADALTVSQTGVARSNGFPQMVRSGDQVVFAWTGSRVLTGVMNLKERSDAK